MTQSARDLVMSLKIAQAVNASGGRAFYVGGYVRDEILGRRGKDIDIEIHGITEERLTEILGTLGEVLTMGASFGILGLRHYTIDIILPRSLITGEVDPFIGTREAARRRDFTMNALMKDILTGEVIDHFVGVRDIREKVIRHVDDNTFLLDPLRVIRAARFAAVLGFTIDDYTKQWCSSADTSSLAHERVFAELENVLLKSPEPSRFFWELESMEQGRSFFPSLLTVHRFDTDIIDRAVKFRESASYKIGFMLTLLCRFMSKNDAASFLSRLTNDIRLTKYVLNMSKLANILAGMPEDLPEISFLRVFDAAESPEDLSVMSDLISGFSRADMLELYRERMAMPYVTGADILREGVSSGPEVGGALRHIHDLRLSGAAKDVQLREAIKYIRGENNG